MAENGDARVASERDRPGRIIAEIQDGRRGESAWDCCSPGIGKRLLGSMPKPLLLRAGALGLETHAFYGLKYLEMQQKSTFMQPRLMVYPVVENAPDTREPIGRRWRVNVRSN